MLRCDLSRLSHARSASSCRWPGSVSLRWAVAPADGGLPRRRPPHRPEPLRVAIAGEFAHSFRNAALPLSPRGQAGAQRRRDGRVQRHRSLTGFAGRTARPDHQPAPALRET